MKQVVIKSGAAELLEVPQPLKRDGFFVVRVIFSFVSSGTESSSLINTAKPLWKRALENPEEVKKAILSYRNKGLSSTATVIKTRLRPWRTFT